jgi:imidazolonepropionase-like amidohydrolase
VIASITSVPARILGVGDRVGSIAPGLDADLVVFSDDPLSTSSHVQRVYIRGEVAFEAPDAKALVVRAGRIWINEERQIENGAVLIEDGRISAVGHSVPHPPFARVIDAGPGSFVTPGFIDGFGHLGLEGDRTPAGPELCLASMVGIPDVTERRVARAGITTVITAPYAAATPGSQLSAIKTSGNDRQRRIVRDSAGVFFDVRDLDPAEVGERLKNRLKSGKEYLEKWQKYEKELAEWREKKAKGTLEGTEAKSEAVKEVEKKPDPITGTWAVTLSGGPIPEPQQATMRLRLTGSDIEGRLSVPGQSEEFKITATFDGKHISGTIETETPFGNPTLAADLVEEDHIVGYVALAEFRIDVDAKRTDKSDVEFKVVRRKTRGKGGRPLPPPIDEGLEPVRAALEKKIPLLVGVRTEAQIAEVLKAAQEYEVGVVLLEANAAGALAPQLVERGVGVVVPKQIVQKRDDEWYHQADDLSRKGVAVAFQSDAEDAARGLPLAALHAVERGMSADAALAAFTTDAAKMYKLDDRIGSLEPGREGDLVIFSGHPFEAGSRVQRVIVSGEEVP